jgi:hypothetical protein
VFAEDRRKGRQVEALDGSAGLFADEYRVVLTFERECLLGVTESLDVLRSFFKKTDDRCGRDYNVHDDEVGVGHGFRYLFETFDDV